MGSLETQIQNTYQGPQPEHYYRHIDDGIGITTLPEHDYRYIDDGIGITTLPEHYYRYIDDGIGITTLSTEEQNSDINFVKRLHPLIPLLPKYPPLRLTFWTSKSLLGTTHYIPLSTTSPRTATPI